MKNKFKTIPINEDPKENRGGEEKHDRRKILKGLVWMGAIGVASQVENKGQKLGKAIEIIKNIFSNDIDGYGVEQADYDENEKTPHFSRDQIQEILRSEIQLKTNADHYLKAYYDLEYNEDFFPKDLFTDDFLIAQQLQESEFDKNAESGEGAVGVMQVMPVCVKDVTIFLEKIGKDKKNNIIDYQGPIYIGHLKNELSFLQNPKNNSRLKGTDREAKIKQLQNSIKEIETKHKDRILDKSDIDGALLLSQMNPNYSKAYGKLYHMRLFNDKYGFGIGQEEYKRGDIKGAWTKLLGCYNAGPRAAKYKRSDWAKMLKTDEPDIYVDRVFTNIDNIAMIKTILDIKELKIENINPFTMRVARAMTRAHGDSLKRKVMNYYIDMLKERHEAKGGQLTETEIINMFLPLHDKNPILETDLA